MTTIPNEMDQEAMVISHILNISMSPPHSLVTGNPRYSVNKVA